MEAEAFGKGCLYCGRAYGYIGARIEEIKPCRVAIKRNACGHHIGYIFQKDDLYAICPKCYDVDTATRILDKELSEFIMSVYE